MDLFNVTLLSFPFEQCLQDYCGTNRFIMASTNIFKEPQDSLLFLLQQMNKSCDLFQGSFTLSLFYTLKNLIH